MEFLIFSDRRCLAHVVPPGFPERPERVQVILDALGADLGARDPGSDHPQLTRAILAVHEAGYYERLEKAIVAGHSFIDTGDNPLSPGTWDACLGAVSTCLRAADWVMGQPGRKALALVRPPGHHAERSMAMGFCYFNNVAVAAQYLVDAFGLSRVAIVDFDVHHGNGTQHLFEDRGDVLYASLHQHPFYPGTGLATERGSGSGLGATLNIPLQAGSNDARYAEAWRSEVLPALASFRPEIILVSAGFDAWQADPVGGMRVSLDGFEEWGRWLRDAALRHCHGRMLLTLEGGYDIPGLPGLVRAHLDGLLKPETSG